MKRSVKALSIILILAALFGLVGGGLSLKDVSQCKAYWEAKGEESDANLTMLEDGLNTLGENEAVYLKGRADYEQGLKDYEAGKSDLEAGQKEYDAGLKTLNEKQAEYDAGAAKLKAAEKQLSDGQKQYDDGKATLAQAEALLSGVAALQEGLATWQYGYNGLCAFRQAVIEDSGTDIGAPAADNVDKYNDYIAGAVDKYTAGVEEGEAAIAEGEAKLQEAYDNVAKLEAQRDEALAAAALLPDDDPQKASLLKTAATCDTMIKVLFMPGITKGEAELAAGREQLAVYTEKRDNSILLQQNNAPAAVAQGQAELAVGVAQAVQGMMGNPDIAAKLPADMAATVEALPKMDYATFNGAMTQISAVANGIVNAEGGVKDQYTAGAAELAAAKKQLDAGYAEYYAGKAQLADGAKQLADGKAQLEAAEKQIAEGEAQLADAEKQLSDGKAQLDEFEAGRQQVIEGLETLKATETYAGIESIADRLGADFSYMKNDADLDIEKGLEAVSVARQFSADNSAAVTSELTTRAIAAVLALVGSVAALIAGVLGLAGKPKGSGVVAVVSAVAAAASVIAAVNAGTALSAVAGSAVGSLIVAAGAVVAVAAVIQAIAAFIPAKAAA